MDERIYVVVRRDIGIFDDKFCLVDWGTNEKSALIHASLANYESRYRPNKSVFFAVIVQPKDVPHFRKIWAMSTTDPLYSNMIAMSLGSEWFPPRDL